MASSSKSLPNDMLMEIMSRNVETLARMRTLSKQLNSDSYSSEFTSRYIVHGFLFRFHKQLKYFTQFIDCCNNFNCSHPPIKPFDFMPVPVKVLALSDSTGICYCQSTEPESDRNRMSYNHYVCKPATREWLQIPKPRTKSKTWLSSMVVGIVVIGSSPLRYKIVRLDEKAGSFGKNRYNTSYRIQVFDSDAPRNWKLLNETVKFEGGEDYEFFLTDDHPVTVNGNLHFTTSASRVVCFDPLTEKWEILSMPDGAKGDYVRPKLTKYEGRLGLIVGESITSVLLFWVMDDYKNKVWVERSPICTKAITGRSRSSYLRGFCSTEAAFMRSDYEKLGWKTEDDAKANIARRMARARINFQLP